VKTRELTRAIEYAKANSPFYREKLAETGQFDAVEFEKLPFTTPAELKQYAQRMLAVPPSEIGRIITLNTSGSSGEPKRVYFTQDDIERTVDFFDKGMRYIVSERDRAAILFTGATRDLLSQGLSRIPVTVVENANDATCVVGSPKQVLALPQTRLVSVLLSADYVSVQARIAIREKFGCKIFEHYGLTESGLGFAVSCSPDIDFCHVRDDEFYVEIIDPATLLPVPDGVSGEIVFTTLRRRGMPLVRYRTGDISAVRHGVCPACGKESVRLDRVGDRGIEKALNNAPHRQL